MTSQNNNRQKNSKFSVQNRGGIATSRTGKEGVTPQSSELTSQTPKPLTADIFSRLKEIENPISLCKNCYSMTKDIRGVQDEDMNYFYCGKCQAFKGDSNYSEIQSKKQGLIEGYLLSIEDIENFILTQSERGNLLEGGFSAGICLSDLKKELSKQKELLEKEKNG